MCKLLFAITLSVLLLPAQTNTGIIRGIVTDSTGAVVSGARVTVTAASTGVGYAGSSNDSGLYSIPNIPTGAVSLTVERDGFRKYVRPGLTMTTGETISLDVKLDVGNLSESVTVTAEASQVESRTSTFGQLIESKSIADLPLGDRRTMNVIQLNGAAVFTGYDSGQKPNFSLAGGRAQSQMFWIDGGSGQNMRLGIGQVDTDPPVDLVEEIKVLSNNYSAEYGASAGGVILETTKSGGNKFHGSAYEYVRNDKFDAPGFFAPVQNGEKVIAPLRYNVFGATLGGPIRHNKTFFFADYEGQRRRTGSVSTLTVPTDAQRGGNFSQTLTAKGQLIPIYDPNTTTTSGSTTTRTQFPGNIIPSSRIDPVAAKLMPFYPLPNRPADNTSGANNFRANTSNGLTHDFWAVKVDHNQSDKDRFTGRYMYNRDNSRLLSVYPDKGADPNNFADAHQRYVYAGWTRTMNATTVNEFRYNYGHRIWHNETYGLGGDYPAKLGLTGVPNTAFPQFAPAGISALGSTSQERRQYPIQQHQVVENLSRIHGKHALKMGFEARRSSNYEVNLPTVSGSFGFSTQPTGLPGNASTGYGLASLLIGFPTSFAQNQTQTLNRHSWYIAGFLQDDWTVTPSLTLNVGVRWETDTAMVDANNRMNSFDQTTLNPVSGTAGVVKFMGRGGYRATPYNTDWNNFGPRIGFAYKMFGTQSTVLRGGYGIFYAHPFDSGVPNAVALGFSQSLSLNSPDNGITAPFLLRNGVPNVAPSAQVLDDSYGAVKVGQNATTAVTFFETNRRTGYSQQFNLGIQRQLPASVVVEVSAIGNLSRKLPSSNLNINQIAPELLGPAHQTQRDRPYPQFSNVTVQSPTLGSSNYYAGMARVEKRFSHGLNLISTYTFSKFLENANDPGTALGADSGTYSNYYNRAVDYGPSNNDVRHRFTFSSVYELPFGEGRRWATKGIGRALLGGWGLGNVTTVQAAPPFTVVAQTNTTNAFSAGNLRPNLLGNPNLSSGQRSVAQWFDTSMFAQPDTYQFGNEGRNVLRGAGIFTMDFSLQRNFPINERMRLQFRGEFFNSLNHTNFGLPGRTLNGAGFGLISSSGPARQIQLGARLSF
jgi:hypothetical protein